MRTISILELWRLSSPTQIDTSIISVSYSSKFETAAFSRAGIYAITKWTRMCGSDGKRRFSSLCFPSNWGFIPFWGKGQSSAFVGWFLYVLKLSYFEILLGAWAWTWAYFMSGRRWCKIAYVFVCLFRSSLMCRFD